MWPACRLPTIFVWCSAEDYTRAVSVARLSYGIIEMSIEDDVTLS
jgi:hypothetical protein